MYVEAGGIWYRGTIEAHTGIVTWHTDCDSDGDTDSDNEEERHEDRQHVQSILPTACVGSDELYARLKETGFDGVRLTCVGGNIALLPRTNYDSDGS